VWSYFSVLQNFTTLTLREDAADYLTVEPEPDFNLTIFPNPVSEILNVEIENNSENLIISIYNMSGQIVFENSVSGNDGIYNLEIDVRNLSAGIYHLRAAGNSGIINRKIVIVE
jgi:hypothetical protein